MFSRENVRANFKYLLFDAFSAFLQVVEVGCFFSPVVEKSLFGLTPRGSREQVFFPIKQNKLSHTSVTFAVKYLNYYSKTIYFEVSSSFCLENKILENILFRNLGKICEIFMHRNSLFSKDKVFAYNQRSIDDFKIGKETFTEEGVSFQRR